MERSLGMELERIYHLLNSILKSEQIEWDAEQLSGIKDKETIQNDLSDNWAKME